MVSHSLRLTYDDYLRMPDDGHRYEIIEGELLVSAAPSRQHQTVLRKLFLLLDEYVTAHDLGEVFFAPFAVRLTPDEPVEPDLLFVSRERAHIISDAGVNGPPDLVVEVISPSTSTRDRVTKHNRYGQVGVQEYWIVDPLQRTVEQYVLRGAEYEPLPALSPETIGSQVLPGLRLPLNAIFG